MPQNALCRYLDPQGIEDLVMQRSRVHGGLGLFGFGGFGAISFERFSKFSALGIGWSALEGVHTGMTRSLHSTKSATHSSSAGQQHGFAKLWASLSPCQGIREGIPVQTFGVYSVYIYIKYIYIYIYQPHLVLQVYGWSFRAARFRPATSLCHLRTQMVAPW